ncbi:uridine kinase [Thermosipho sp. 1063]|uniref:uridine kinase n=1 Tax=Thermosipho sp. 1063 TaxID=1462747 RepID=UPI0009507F10|nr:uridine kinase [Thermosipho sp. 1063]APT72095.1 uridine kinase [Thermosipho sp. 1063]
MVIICIGGGTGSGKTTLANQIKENLPNNSCMIVPMDNYYLDRSHLSFQEREKINYDHPNAIESSLLIKHIQQLKNGMGIEMPLYDFSTHTRKREYIKILPTNVIIIEGIFALYYKDLREEADLKIYVDTESDIRFGRRLRRDLLERGRKLESVYEQYFKTVKPMHETFVEPTKRFADVIIPEGGKNERAIKVIKHYLFDVLGDEIGGGKERSN